MKATQQNRQQADVEVVAFDPDRHVDAALPALARLDGRGRATTAVAARYLRSILEADNASLNTILVGGRVAGVLAVMNVSDLLGTAELAIATHPDFDGMGLGRTVGEYALRYLFEAKGLRSVHTHCTSQEGLNLCQRLGMRRAENIVTMQMTREDWDGLSVLDNR